MFSVTISTNNKRETSLHAGSETPRQILTAFGANPERQIFAINGTNLSAATLDQSLSSLATALGITGTSMFLSCVVKTDNA